MNNADELIQEITDLLIDKGCTINKSAVLDLAIYIMEREKKVIQSL